MKNKDSKVYSSFDDLGAALGLPEGQPDSEKTEKKALPKEEKKQNPPKKIIKNSKPPRPKIIRFNHDQFNQLREDAYQLFRKKDFKETLIKYNEAVDMVENFVKSCYKQADIKKKNNDVDGALREYRESKKIFKKLIPIIFRRANIKLQTKDFSSALSDFNMVIKYQPNHVLAYIRRIKIKEKLGDFDAILTDLTKLIEIDKEESNYYYKRAGVNLIKGNIEAAFNDVKEAYKKDKRNPGLLIAEAKKLSSKGKTNQALKNLDLAVNRLDSIYRKFSRKTDFSNMAVFQSKTGLPYNEAYTERANIREKLGQYTASEKDFSKVIEISPDNALAYYRRGEIRQLKNNKSGALKDFKQCIAKDNDNIHARQHIAILSAESGDYNEALRQYSLILEKEPYNVPVFQKRAEVFFQAEKYQEALTDIEKVLSFKEKSPSLYLKRGQIKLKMGDKTGFRDFAASFNLDKESSAGLLKKAELMIQQGDSDNALNLLNESYRKAVKSFKVAIASSGDEALLAGFPERKKTAEDLRIFNEIGIDITRLLITRAKELAAIYKYADAVHDVTHALEMMPDNIDFLKERASIILSSGKCKDALKDIKKALSIDDRRDDIHFLAARTYALAEDHEMALKEFNKSVKINPNNALYHTEMGIFLESRELWEAAVYAFKRAIEKDSAQHRSFAGLARIQSLTDHFKDLVLSEVNARKAVDIEENTYNLMSLAIALSELGKFDDAVKVQEKVLDISDKSESEFAGKLLDHYRNHKKYSEI